MFSLAITCVHLPLLCLEMMGCDQSNGWCFAGEQDSLFLRDAMILRSVLVMFCFSDKTLWSKTPYGRDCFGLQLQKARVCYGRACVVAGDRSAELTDHI